MASITLSNCKDGDERTYPVVVLRGSAQGNTVSAINESLRSKTKPCEVPLVRGSFKVLVELLPGENKIKLKAKSSELKLVLRYCPLPTVYKVNPIYLTADTGETWYLTQFANDRQDYRNKFDVAVKLLQTFTAEQMHAAGHGYKTFSVAYDSSGVAPIHVLNMECSAESLRALSEDDLYMKCLQRVSRAFPDQREKNLAIMAFTGYDPVKQKPLAHTALGGPSLALFSCNGMCSWPADIPNVAAAFNNTTPVDVGKIWNDTNNRSRLWALASTTIGVTLHELGHSFGLGHYDDPFSIMSRGFDYFNRHFVSTEPSSSGKVTDLLPGDNAARWNAEAAALLSLSPWFQAVQVEDSIERNGGAFTVANVDKDTERRYPVIVIRGTAANGTLVKAFRGCGNDGAGSGIANATANANANANATGRVDANADGNGTRVNEIVAQTTAYEGKYKLVVPLVVGANEMMIAAGTTSIERTIYYEPLKNTHKVKLVYFVGADGDTRYLTQFDDDKQNFADRLRVAGRLVQTFSAEAMNQAGFGYRTFTLDADENDKPVVEVVRCEESSDVLRQLGGGELFEKLQSLLDDQFPGDHLRFIGIMGFTNYDAESQSPHGHTAIGAGRLSLFSSVGLCSWPDSVDQVTSAFTDNREVERTRIFDDSSGRGRLWALASTTIGVTLHLLCKTWGLEGVGYDPFSIMSRGFDFFSRHFVVLEPVAGHPSGMVVVDSNSVRFDAESAKQIKECAWFQLD
ncbi:MAG TPA: hypothetical protein V6C86_13330 [Oculatellaceae cyanobacterium]